uniref:Uncharacterized protein n=1 Tax=Aegilops tauschii subsp. strangulata TaxID=200361 RepID=A0A453BQR0_AEGTS
MGGAYWPTLLNSGRVSLDWAAKMANSGTSVATGSSSDTLYKELWHACARPLITVPHQALQASPEVPSSSFTVMPN